MIAFFSLTPVSIAAALTKQLLTKQPVTALGWHHLKEDFGRLLWRALVYPLLPSESDEVLHCCFSHHP